VLWGETSVQVARNRPACTLLVQLDADTEQREVRRGSESLTPCQQKSPRQLPGLFCWHCALG
jgi:hypothetical protein